MTGDGPLLSGPFSTSFFLGYQLNKKKVMRETSMERERLTFHHGHVYDHSEQILRCRPKRVMNEIFIKHNVRISNS